MPDAKSQGARGDSMVSSMTQGQAVPGSGSLAPTHCLKQTSSLIRGFRAPVLWGFVGPGPGFRLNWGCHSGGGVDFWSHLPLSSTRTLEVGPVTARHKHHRGTLNCCLVFQ